MIDIQTKSEGVQNYLKAAFFQGPDWIPCWLGVMPPTWGKYGEQLEDLLLEFPGIFPGFRKGRPDLDAPGDKCHQLGRFTDNWGCVWDNIAEGLDGAVVDSPLKDWADLEGYRVPDPLTESDGWGPPPDWEAQRRNCQRAKQNGRLAWGYLPHGFMYMRLYYLRGFQNFMLDVATGDPRLGELTQMVLEYNLAVIEKNIECGVEIMEFGDDLGFQNSLAISPVKWREYLLPCYREMFGLCRRNGVAISLHSDGHILDIIPDLVECGVNILNPQAGPNGLDGLERVAKGKVCIYLDLDARLFPFATPEQLSDHIHEAVERLDSPEGGLMLYAECLPDTPLSNIRAICEAFEDVGGPMMT